MDFPTINLALTGANIMNLRKAAGLSVHDLQMAFGFNSPQAIYKWQKMGQRCQRSIICSLLQHCCMYV